MKRRRSRSTLTSALALLAMAVSVGAFALSRQPWQRPALPARDGPAITDVKAWGYQLQRLGRVPEHVDLLVTDYSRDGSAGAALTPAEVSALKRRPDGSRRIVLSYLSIGEAESYRYYWMPTWALSRPRWLGDENPEWKGNHPVKFWLSDWQGIILEPKATWLDWAAEHVLSWRKPYLDRIIEAGFDGVYLDRIDVFTDFEDERRTARRDMIAFVARIAAYARERRPGFLVVPQNAEELLADRRYLSTIDAIAKEDLWHGAGEDGKANADTEIAESIAHLDRATAAGKPVLVVEYVAEPGQQTRAILAARERGYLPLIARRALDAAPEKLPEVPPQPAAPAAPPAPTAPPGPQ